LFEKRLRPAIEKKALKEEDIRDLVREAEDFGRQHVFLFEPVENGPDPKSLLKTSRVKKFLDNGGWSEHVNVFSLPVMPADIEANDIHFDGTYASFKFVEPRTIVLLERQETPEGWLIKRVPQQHRAIDVVRLQDNGLLEFRIQSIQGTVDYVAIVERLWIQMLGFIAKNDFREKDLSGLRRAFTVKPTAAIRKLVRVRRARGQDADGTGFDVHTRRPDGDLLKSVKASQSMAAWSGSTAHLGHTSVGFLPQEDANLHREIGVIFPDSVNELQVLSNCTRLEYEYILENISLHS
jgi:hypothetical protein